MTVCTRTSKCTRTRFTLCTIVIVVVVVVCVLLVIAGALLAFTVVTVSIPSFFSCPAAAYAVHASAQT